MEIYGRYGVAVVYTDNIENTAYKQILNFMNEEIAHEAKVRIMPDVHAGAGCVIGTTMKVTDKVIPDLVGVDIGCGLASLPFYTNEPISKDLLEQFDNELCKALPRGFKRHNSSRSNEVAEFVQRIISKMKVTPEELGMEIGDVINSIGTLGGGNHFVEIGAVEQNNNLYKYHVTVHTGSRNFGLRVASYYSKKAKEQNNYTRNPEFSYIHGQDCSDYLNDMKLAQEYASYNRKEIIRIIKDIMMDIFENIGVDVNTDYFETVHNYIDHNNILRKGAVSAGAGELFLLPMNMRDGIYLCEGKGNDEWNSSAPHGAGRLLSRGVAKNQLSLKNFKNQMQNIYSSCVDASRLDESPDAYKNFEEILACIDETCSIIYQIKSIYNFKG